MRTGNGNGWVRVGEFEVDLARGELFRSGKQVRVQRKPFQILELLLRSAGEVVTREQIYEAIWPGVHVDWQRCLNTAVRKLRAVLADTAAASKVIETVGNRGYRLLVPAETFLVEKTNQPARQGVSLAVLPLEDLSGTEDDYFSYGMTEQMIAQLGRMNPDISVIAPVSVMHYRGTSKKSAEVGQELASDYLLCGSVFHADDSFRITAKLIRVRDGICVWADSYAREKAAIFLVQDDIAKHIAKAIRHSLPASSVRGRNLTTEPSVYEQYLKAGYFFGKGHEPAFNKSVELFQEVIARDPDFAPAHGALAIILTCVAHYGGRPPKTVYEQVHMLTSQALTLSADLPDPYVALGYENMLYRAHFPASEKAFLRATELNPSHALGHQGYSMLMTVLGRHDEALTAMHMARDLDPLSPMVNALLGCALYYAGHMQKALAQALQTVELEQNFPSAHMVVGWILLALDDREGAIRAHRSAVRCCPESSLMRLGLAQALAAVGNHDEARSQLQAVLHARHTDWASPYWIALVYSALGERDTAFDWLGVAIDECDGWRVYLAIDPRVRALARDPRFRPLVQRIGLPEK